jgi:hypothetical protein
MVPEVCIPSGVFSYVLGNTCYGCETYSTSCGIVFMIPEVTIPSGVFSYSVLGNTCYGCETLLNGLLFLKIAGSSGPECRNALVKKLCLHGPPATVIAAS